MRAKLIAAVAAGAAGMFLFGAGAAAAFTDAVHGIQKITTGRLSVSVQAVWPAKASGNAVSFPAIGPMRSTFTSLPQAMIVQNTGNIPITGFRVGAADANNNAALRNGIYVEIDAYPQQDKGGTARIVYNGPLTGLENNPVILPTAVAPGHHHWVFVTFYAGHAGRNPLHLLDRATQADDNAPSLATAAQGGVVTPTINLTYTG